MEAQILAPEGEDFYEARNSMPLPFALNEISKKQLNAFVKKIDPTECFRLLKNFNISPYSEVDVISKMNSVLHYSDFLR